MDPNTGAPLGLLPTVPLSAVLNTMIPQIIEMTRSAAQSSFPLSVYPATDQNHSLSDFHAHISRHSLGNTQS
jgi:hypothetical protein